MRVGYVSFALLVASAVAHAEADDERVKERFKSDSYTVAWGKVATYDTNPELEIGDGNGHGGTLGWLWFQSDSDAVQVLSIRLGEGRELIHSTWPSDRVAVEVKRARMKKESYDRLIRDLAIVDSAQLAPVSLNRWKSSTNDFWVYARVMAKSQTLIDLNWSGYQNDLKEAQYAKPAAAVALARNATKALDFAQHALTDEERRWASGKFSRDMKKFREIEKAEEMQSHWWVRERYIMAIGVIGDAAALPTLREILTRAPEERHKYDFAGIDMSKSQDRLVYYAINAITRLTKKDVRPQPVEEMDVEATRRKVLELLPEAK